MTSNIGSHVIQENMADLTPDNREEVIGRTKSQIDDLLKRSIRPEFLNRIDEIIMFLPLTLDEVRKIVEIQILEVSKKLKKNGVDLILSEKALDFISKTGYDPQFGARPIKRVIQRQLLNELAREIIGGELENAETIKVDEKDGKLVFKADIKK